MWRRPLLRVDIARTWQHAREQFAAVVAERDAFAQRAGRDQARSRRVAGAAYRVAHATRARQAAEEECRRLYREREIARARAAERDPAQPLQ